MPLTLTPSARDTLLAVARTVLPHLFSIDGACRVDLVSLVERASHHWPDTIITELTRGLDLLGHPASALATIGCWERFADLPDASRDAMFARWGRGALGVQRMVYQGLRRVLMVLVYGDETERRAIGVLEPFHTRATALSFEGPVAHAHEHGPVARTSLPVARPSDPLEGHAGMLRGASFSGTLELDADVVVIGSGAGGAVAAARFAEAGRRVVVLEEGEHNPSHTLSERELEMTLRLYADGGFRTTDDLAISLFQGRGVGGGTIVNWMIMLRPEDHVLEEWARDHGTEGMDPRSFGAVLDRIEREVHASQVPDDMHSMNNQLLLRGASQLGWRARGAKVNAKNCVRAGTCGMGCRHNAKQDAAHTFLPRALAHGARIISNAHAERIEHGTRDRKRVVANVVDPVTRRAVGRVLVNARTVMVAAGAIGTPALLQRSGMGGGGVGRFLRLHPTTMVLGRYAHAVQGGSGIPMTTICDEFSRRDANGYGFWVECPPLHPIVAALAFNEVGRAHREVMEDFARLGSFVVLVRDGGDPAVSNGDVRVDARGRTRIRYTLGHADRANLVAGMQAAARMHLAAGAREALTLHTDPVRISSERDLASIATRPCGPNQISLLSAHVNGTCRMGRDPARSGVNANGQRHGVPGVYVCDGSLLPTGLGVNPQATIMAIASMIAERAIEAGR